MDRDIMENVEILITELWALIFVLTCIWDTLIFILIKIVINH